MITLRCVAWDHPRCTQPVEASLAAFRRARPDIEVIWERRSLFSFGEGDIGEQTDRYDLVIYDHPFVGEVARKGLMLDLAKALDPADIEMFRRDSLGPSFASYEWDGGLFALPIDAAAQTSALRPDLMARVGAEAPKTFAELEALHRALEKAGLGIVTPLKQIDLFCLVLTLSANLGVPVGPERPDFLPDGTFAEILGHLRRLGEISVPGSRGINPIAAHELMSTQDDVAYAPFLFNYTNYARPGRDRIVLAADIPGVRGPDASGACIGGAGIGVSARTSVPEAAVTYARFLCDPAYQAGEYVQNGGQPASLTAWRSAEANALTNGFFDSCVTTLRQSYLRPRFDGFMPFARQTGPALVRFMDGDLSETEIIVQMREAWKIALNQAERMETR